MSAASPENKLGPNVRAGFMLAPVYPPKRNANIATVEPTTIAIGSHWSVFLMMRRIEAMSRNVIPISIAMNAAHEVLMSVGPAPPSAPPANAPPHNCPVIWETVSLLERSPLLQNAMDTAGLM